MIPFFRAKSAADSEVVIVKYLKADRSPLCCYGPGDVAGWPRSVAEKLIAKGYAELYDAGKGPGVPNYDLTSHGIEPWENQDWGTYYAAFAKK